MTKIWEEPDDHEDEPAEAPTCNRCGKTDLEWVDTGGAPTRWRLFDGNRLHECPPASINEFEDLTR